MARLWRRERDDFLLLIVVAAAVPLIWRLLLGWSPGRLVSGFDAVPNALLVARELVETGGDWSSLLYRADLLGGTKLRDALGPFPLFSWLARAGVGAAAVYNLSVWLVQALLAFLGARAAGDIAIAWRPSGDDSPWWMRCGAALLAAFTPIVGWRVGYGHLNLLTGMLPFAAAVALLVASARRAVSATLLLVATCALGLGTLFTGYQLIFYGVVFGGPILFGLWWSLGHRWRALVPLVLCLLVAGVLVWPVFESVLAHARGSDAARSLGRSDVVYRYLTGRWQDVLGSLFWTSVAVPGGQPELYAHETNIPFGPVLPLLLLVPWKRARVLGVGLTASALSATLFALDVRPISRMLIAAIPTLGSFRVPTRALIPCAFALSVVALAGLGTRNERRSLWSAASAVAGFLAGFLLPSMAREVLSWSVAVVYVVPWLRRRTMERLTASAVALTLAGATIGAFQERLLPFPRTAEILARCDRLGQVVRAARPEWASPLNRVKLSFEFPEMGPNTAFASGLSSLDGYYYPSRRFLELYWALRGQPYEPSSVVLHFPTDQPWARTFFQLYNVGWEVGTREGTGGGLSAWSLGPTAGPAWFSARIQRTSSMATLAEELRRAGDNLARRAPQVAWVVESDVRVPATLPASVSEQCLAARVTRVDAERRRRWMAVDVESPADCPLTLATNYAETLHATLDGPQGRELPPFPSYGALAGVLVPQGARRVWVAP